MSAVTVTAGAGKSRSSSAATPTTDAAPDPHRLGLPGPQPVRRVAVPGDPGHLGDHLEPRPRWNLLTPLSGSASATTSNIFRYEARRARLDGHGLLRAAEHPHPDRARARHGHAAESASCRQRVRPGRCACCRTWRRRSRWQWSGSGSSTRDRCRSTPLLYQVGITGPTWLSSQLLALPVVAFANIWQYVGLQHAVLPGRPPGDPASALRGGRHRRGEQDRKQFLHLTLPLLRPTMLFVLVTGVIGSFQVFDTVYVMTNGGSGQLHDGNEPATSTSTRSRGSESARPRLCP